MTDDTLQDFSDEAEGEEAADRMDPCDEWGFEKDEKPKVARRCSTCRLFPLQGANSCRADGCDGWNGGNEPKFIALKKLLLQRWAPRVT